MIRLFKALCNRLLDTLSDEEVFLEASGGFRHHGAKCPRCHTKGKLSPHGGYSRYLISDEGGEAVTRLIWVLRFECGPCGATHALLPDILVPYSPYSLRFKLTVLLAYFERETTVVAVCGRFGIAVSTLYAWKGLLLDQKELLLGVLISQKEPALAFLRGLAGSADFPSCIRGFFQRYGFSFLQNKPMPATLSRPP